MQEQTETPDETSSTREHLDSEAERATESLLVDDDDDEVDAASPSDAVDAVSPSDAQPIIRIPGGKRHLAAQLAGTIPPTLNITNYVEPFFGGGALYFHLCREGRLSNSKNNLLSDLNMQLMELYREIRYDPKVLRAKLEQLHSEYVKNPEAVYYAVRKLWNQRNWSPAKHMFLRFGSFNGLWRENKKGEMNAPWGKHAKLALPSFERLQTVSQVLRKADLEDGTYSAVLESADYLQCPGTVLYVDPPYAGTFDAYTSDGFSAGQQEQLIAVCSEWEAAGAHVIYTNSNAELISTGLAKYWPTANVVEVLDKRRVNSDGKGRAAVTTLLAHSKGPQVHA